jgi:hypothetical protein
MLFEALAAVLVGAAALFLVFQPLLHPQRKSRLEVEPLDPEETPRGVALTALKEIDFDRETGKLSEADYLFLKAKYTAQALVALREEQSRTEPALSCVTCGPRPEPDAIFCSTCGLRLDPNPAPGRVSPAPAPAHTPSSAFPLAQGPSQLSG